MLASQLHVWLTCHGHANSGVPNACLDGRSNAVPGHWRGAEVYPHLQALIYRLKQPTPGSPYPDTSLLLILFLLHFHLHTHTS